MERPSFASVRSGLWQALLGQLGSSPWTGDPVEVVQAGWRLRLDSYRVPAESFDHTRMTIALPSLGFRFRIHEPNAFSWVGTLFGLLDIEIGDEHFDARWVVKASSRSRIRRLLDDPELRRQIEALQHCALSLEPDESRIDPERSDDVRGNELSWDELILARADLQTRVDGLQPMFDLLAATLERLEALAPGWA